MALEISTQTNKSSGLEKVWVTCPACKRREWYYGFWARRCNSCNFIFGNTRSINEDLGNRLRFHRHGF